jgi:hypothetical protein
MLIIDVSALTTGVSKVVTLTKEHAAVHQRRYQEWFQPPLLLEFQTHFNPMTEHCEFSQTSWTSVRPSV